MPDVAGQGAMVVGNPPPSGRWCGRRLVGRRCDIARRGPRSSRLGRTGGARRQRHGDGSRRAADGRPAGAVSHDQHQRWVAGIALTCRHDPAALDLCLLFGDHTRRLLRRVGTRRQWKCLLERTGGSDGGEAHRGLGFEWRKCSERAVVTSEGREDGVRLRYESPGRRRASIGGRHDGPRAAHHRGPRGRVGEARSDVVACKAASGAGARRGGRPGRQLIGQAGVCLDRRRERASLDGEHRGSGT